MGVVIGEPASVPLVEQQVEALRRRLIRSHIEPFIRLGKPAR
jgi:hypothetical protein